MRDGLSRKFAQVDIDRIIELDGEFLDNVQKGDELRAQRNARSEEIGRRKRDGENADDLHAHMKEVSAQIKQIESHNQEIDAELEALLLTIPNIPHDSVPVGQGRVCQRGGAPVGGGEVAL